jgi:hypothetical protein
MVCVTNPNPSVRKVGRTPGPRPTPSSAYYGADEGVRPPSHFRARRPTSGHCTTGETRENKPLAGGRPRAPLFEL